MYQFESNLNGWKIFSKFSTLNQKKRMSIKREHVIKLSLWIYLNPVEKYPLKLRMFSSEAEEKKKPITIDKFKGYFFVDSIDRMK